MENLDRLPPRKLIRRTAEAWAAIRVRVEGGETVQALAVELGVTVRTVRRQTGLEAAGGVASGERKAPRRLTDEEEAEVCRLFALNTHAKDLALKFNVSKTTISKTLKRHECRRRDLGQAPNSSRRRQSDGSVRQATLRTQRTAADRFVMDLPDGASFGAAARAAALSAVAHLKEASPTKCQQYLKSAEMLERVDQRASGGWGDPFADTPARRAALDGLREAFGFTAEEGESPTRAPDGAVPPHEGEGDDLG